MNIDWSILRYIGAVATTMLTNTAFGMAKAAKTSTFDIEELKKGLVKYGFIMLGVILLFLTGVLVPEVTVPVGDLDAEVSFINGIMLVATATIVFYGAKAFINLISALGLTSIKTPAQVTTHAVEEEVEDIIEEVNEEEGLG